jgi:hypothetical protein
VLGALVERITATHFGAGKLIRPMIVRLGPGYRVLPHTDDLPVLHVSHRVHIPLRTDKAVVFVVGNQVVPRVLRVVAPGRDVKLVSQGQGVKPRAASPIERPFVVVEEPRNGGAAPQSARIRERRSRHPASSAVKRVPCSSAIPLLYVHRNLLTARVNAVTPQMPTSANPQACSPSAAPSLKTARRAFK